MSSLQRDKQGRSQQFTKGVWGTQGRMNWGPLIIGDEVTSILLDET